MTSEVLQKPAVLITGVSSGVGKATARFLAQRNYQIYGSVRRTSDAQELQLELGESFTPLEFDLSNADTIERSIKQLANFLKDAPLQGLINNAGVATLGPLECLDDERFAQSLQINVTGTRQVINACLPLLRRPAKDNKKLPRKIINNSSLSGIFNTPISGAYCVSKHALESLGEVYRRELLPQGIDVVSIRSGPIESRIWEKNTADKTDPDSRYAKMIKSAQHTANEAEKHAIPAEVFAALAYDILQNRRRSTHYELGKGARIVRLLNLLPVRWVDRLILRNMKV